MVKEKDIVHENGKYWVLKRKDGFHVMKTLNTHSVCDSAYATLDLAKCRCDYLANHNK